MAAAAWIKQRTREREFPIFRTIVVAPDESGDEWPALLICEMKPFSLVDEIATYRAYFVNICEYGNGSKKALWIRVGASTKLSGVRESGDENYKRKQSSEWESFITKS